MVDNFSSYLMKFLTRPLFVLSGTEVTCFSILVFLVILLLTLLASLVLQRLLRRILQRKVTMREGTLAALLRLVHYSVIIVGFGIGLQTVGINLGALFAAGAVFAIAIGFAMQNIVQNFVSGVILLLERSIKPGDIIEVEGTIVKVIEMGIRTTVVRTRRDEELIMPNSIFSQSTVKNYTLRDNEFRLAMVVGVSYDSDMEKVIAVLEKTAHNVSWRLPEPLPRVLLQDFADSSVNFCVYLSVDNPWEQAVYTSDLRKEIWFAFKKAGITIAYPQLDVHFDSPVTEAVAQTLQRVK